MRDSTEELFWDKVDFTQRCWNWTAYLDRDGYGLFKGRTFRGRAARLAYLLLVGDISPGLVVDHLCRNRACVNPYHLQPVPQKVNAQRGERGQRTHCKRAGHPLFGANLYVANGLRNCKRCKADRQAEYMARQRDAR